MPYIINEKTLALVPMSKKTKVLELNKSRYINETTVNIVSKNCIINGSTLDGRQKGSAFLIGSTYKPPILLNSKNNIILIPTASIRNSSCIWISLKHILNYKNKNDYVVLEFKNHQKISLNISYNIFDNQVLRATRLESALRGRNSKKYL